MRNVKLVIFDLDGTAADTLDGITEAINRTMREGGYPTHERESVLTFVNFNTRRYVEEALPPEARTDGEIDRLLDAYTRHYEGTYTLSTPYGGMTELMERLSGRCLVAINSNKQDSFVKVLASRLFADVPLIAAEGYRPDRPFKPDPSMALAIMAIASERLEETLTPDQCIYVGDSDVDYYTAKNAGMQAVSVSWGYRSHEFLKSLGDQPVAATVDELWEILSGLQA